MSMDPESNKSIKHGSKIIKVDDIMKRIKLAFLKSGTESDQI